MATLTTIDGHEISFKPSSVVLITDHDTFTGAAVTCIYGVMKALVQTNEAAIDFMQRLRITNHFARLSRAGGWPIWVNGEAVSAVNAPLPNSYVDGVNSVVTIEGYTFGISEAPPVAIDAINRHGGKL